MVPVGWDPFSGYNYMNTRGGYQNTFGNSTFGNDAAANGLVTPLGIGGTKDAESADGKVKAVVNPGESTKVQPGKKSSPAECQTCKERKYQDGSDEMVSFKSATHISPTAAGAAVRAHEGEHVSNAYTKAAKDGGKVLQASVAIHTAICPECGRSYVSGGTTTTKIKYGDEKNPYVKNMKNADNGILAGMNFDAKG